MATLADALQRYNLTGPGTREASLAMMPFASLLRLGQARPATEKAALISDSIPSILIKVRSIITDIVRSFTQINDEKDKQRLITDRIQRIEAENRLEAGAPQEAEEQIEVEERRPEEGFGSILARMLYSIGRVASSIARTALQAVESIVRFSRRIAIRAIPGVGLLATATGALRALDAVREGRTAAEGYREGRESVFGTFTNWLFGESSETRSRMGGQPQEYTGSRGVRGDERTAMQFFMSQGWTMAQAAGIVGNLIQESSLDPSRLNPRENAQGIAQWTPTGGRQQRIEQYLGRPIREASFEDQLRAIQWEFTTTEANAANRLRATTTPEEAATVVDQFYERSRGTERGIRIDHARRLFQAGQQNRQERGSSETPQTTSTELPPGPQMVPSSGSQAQIPTSTSVTPTPASAPGLSPASVQPSPTQPTPSTPSTTPPISQIPQTPQATPLAAPEPPALPRQQSSAGNPQQIAEFPVEIRRNQALASAAAREIHHVLVAVQPVHYT